MKAGLKRSRFVYLENNGPNHFDPFMIAEAKSGRQVSLDARDLDSDGLMDIVLANFATPLKEGTNRFIGLFADRNVLRNIGKGQSSTKKVLAAQL